MTSIMRGRSVHLCDINGRTILVKRALVRGLGWSSDLGRQRAIIVDLRQRLDTHQRTTGSSHCHSNGGYGGTMFRPFQTRHSASPNVPLHGPLDRGDPLRVAEPSTLAAEPLWPREWQRPLSTACADHRNCHGILQSPRHVVVHFAVDDCRPCSDCRCSSPASWAIYATLATHSRPYSAGESAGRTEEVLPVLTSSRGSTMC